MFTLRDHTFPVATATLHATFHPADSAAINGWNPLDQLRWHIELAAEEQEYDDEWWAPYLYLNEGAELKIPSWKALEGQTLSWQGRFTDNPYAGFIYVFEHEEISQSTIMIGPRSGTKFGLKWTGLGDILWNDTFKEDVPFTAECEASFTGININIPPNEPPTKELLAQIEKHISIKDLQLTKQLEGHYTLIPLD